MSEIFENKLFKRSMRELKYISKDKSNSEYMTECLEKVVDFDKVKDLYVRKYCGSGLLKSVDALAYFEGNNRLVFIEFKNGKLDFDKINQEVCDKVIDSLFIFNDIVCKNIFYARKNIEFILVYNEEKNESFESNIEEDSRRLNLLRFKKKYFIDVNMLTKLTFRKLLEKNNFL